MNVSNLKEKTPPPRPDTAAARSPDPGSQARVPRAARDTPAVTLREHVVEIISDSGEGAQKCGQSFATIAARMGNRIWTVEIIPAEIEPPARSIEGASGSRVRLAAHPVSNGGDEADLIIAFNEQALLGRVRAGELKPGCIILLESKWRSSRDRNIAASYATACADLSAAGYRLYEVPLEEECLKHVADAHRGKNMFVLGLLCSIYSLHLDTARQQVALTFEKKGEGVVETNLELLEAGYVWAAANLDIRFQIPVLKASVPRIVVNGNTALALGIVASGMELCAMYPITPATSTSHYLSGILPEVGGLVHQAEDEIAACCFALGASYAGKCAVTITSGPGFSLKQEAIGLAVMGEIPLVVVNVQRGGPSTGLPTKTEQGDLLAACFGDHGDAPKVVMAPATIEDCFYSMITARRIAEMFNMVVIVLTDASLASAQQPFARPQFDEGWLAPPADQGPVPPGAEPYEWDHRTGLARRYVPGQPGGMFCLTGLAHDRLSRVAYDPITNEEGVHRRSLKLAALQKTLRTPAVYGDEDGELLVVGWGSTRGAIEEAVARVRAESRRVSSLHLTFLQPMPSGVKEILRRFNRVLTVENNWCDRPKDEIIDEDNRRYSNLAWLLRARYLVDIDCWGDVSGQPLKPGTIARVMREKLQ